MAIKAVATVLVLAVSVIRPSYGAAFVQQKLTFDTCGSAVDIFTVSWIDVSPYPLKRGQDATVELNFTASATVNGGQIFGSISGMAIPKYDLCSNLPTPCPVGIGPHKFKFQQMLPPFVPAGTYNVKLQGTSDVGKPLFCTTLTVQVHITVNIKLEDALGTVAAFADFNSDKATDILILNSTGVIQSLYAWSSGRGQFEFTPLEFPFPAAAARAADFDGDGMLDLVWQRASESSCSPVYVSWLSRTKENELQVSGHLFLYNASTTRSPIMAVDVDGDHISDVLGATCERPHLPVLWISSGKNHSFVSHDLEGVAEAGREGGAGAILGFNYMDLSGDCVPELLAFRAGLGGVLDVWRWTGNQLVWRQNVSLNLMSAVQLSPVTFTDLTGDGITELVLYACYEADHHVCVNTSLVVMFPETYPEIDVTNCRGSSASWKLSFHKIRELYLSHNSEVPVGIPMTTVSAQPILGDLDLDSSLDVLLPAIDLRSNETFLLHVSGSSDGSFSPRWRNMKDYSVAGAMAVDFFDIYEDGVLDVLVRTKCGGVGTDCCTLSAFRQSVGADHTFLKIFVLEGFCYSHCSALILPYGSVRSGAAVSYSTTGRSGHTQTTVAAVKPSSAPLQLPFVLFGLGETPNFIERLTVGMVVRTTGAAAASKEEGLETGVEVRFRTWKNLVPNSQVIVIPTPPDHPSSWHLSLYVTPSHLVYTTIGVLCALGAGLALLIVLLHAREKYQDSQERKQAKHKFHFNAM